MISWLRAVVAEQRALWRMLADLERQLREAKAEDYANLCRDLYGEPVEPESDAA